VRFVGIVAVAFISAAGTANAQEPHKCSAKYSLEEHLILEWAALGGDPHAQFAIGQCAFPGDPNALSAPEKIYAMKWLMLATCDSGGTANAEERDRMTRKLKYQSDISFRRFGGIQSDEKWTSREKDLISFRVAQEAVLASRFDTLKASMSEAQKAEARDALAEQLSRMGGIGLMRLADLTTCKNFGASKPFAAASYAAAADSWRSSPSKVAFGQSVHAEAEAADVASKRYASLSAAEKRAADLVKTRLLKTEPSSLAALEEKAALGRLQELGALHAGEGHSLFSGRSVTLAAQYALESLGFVEFINGPDNDYGPSTIEAVRKAQASYGNPETRWLSHEEARQLLCDAATKRSDPVSFYHLGLMFSQGWGFKQDLDRAAFAIGRAKALLDVRLEHLGDLPAWKQQHYPGFLPKIGQAKAAIDAAREVIPSESETITNENLCPQD
jgi:TPR repeat protein